MVFPVLVHRKGLETLRIRSIQPSRAALIRVAIYGSRPPRHKNNPNPKIRFGLFFFGANVLIGLFEKPCHTNGFLDFRATNFLVFHFTKHT